MLVFVKRRWVLDSLDFMTRKVAAQLFEDTVKRKLRKADFGPPKWLAVDLGEFVWSFLIP